MEENDIEDVSFLPGDTRAHKKSVYEPSGSQRCRQIICSRNKAMAATIATGLVILAVALFAAFARPVLHPSCPVASYFINQSTTETPVPITTTPELATNGKPFPWKKIRLPRDVIPEWYHIHMHPNLTESWFRGNVEMHLRVLKATNFIVFHVKEMNITSYSLKFDKTDGEEISVVEALEYKKFEQYYLGLDRTLTKNEQILLRVEFRAKLVSKLAGLYKSMYHTKDNQTRVIATTHFEATDARAAFPCFDEPDMKANFSLSMVRDMHHISLFNMPLLNSTPYKGSALLMEDKFETSVKMSTYLVAFVVCDFANLTDYTKSGVMVRVFAPTDVIQQARFALDTAIQILDHYDTFFGIKYPLPKQDLIAIPDFAAGAMENWGLITYRTTSILYDPGESSTASQQWVAIVVAHELAHQWFGNLVTMKWWDDLWLNEGFASFVEYLGVESVKPEWKLFDQFVAQNLLGALNLDSLSNSHAIQIPVHNPNQINEIFDSISYDKGSSILRMLQNFVGMKKFKAGLHNYLKDFSYSNTQTSDLWDALSQVADISELDGDVKTVMDTWTRQMGYPVVTLTRTGNKIEATQERFLLYAGETVNPVTSPFNYKWYIPLNYISSEEITPASSLWMKLNSASFTVPPETTWIKANSGMYGFYRVNYDESMWDELITVLKSDNHQVFSAGDRAGLIDDAFALSRAGRMKITTALDLSTYLVHEQDYVPWVAAIDNLDYIGHRLLDRPAYADFKEYFLNLLSPIIGKLGWEDKGSHLDKFLRQMVLREAVYLGQGSAVPEGKRHFDQWMNEGKSLDPNLKSVIYQAGVQYGGEKEWEFCWKRYQTTKVASEKKLMLSALAATRDTQLLTRYLHYSLDSNKIRSQDCASVIGSVAVNPSGRLLAWRFVRQNWATILERMGSGLFTGSRIIRSIASSFSTQFDFDEVESFFKDRNVGSGERAVKQALESIKMNMQWLESHEKSVSEWLHQHKNIPQNA
ncbi:endoplasmic reticulum aminopeptidase 2-like [Liolophura sinensis]|uniref:endoplasmic reticulum aminopeptidase 2-like n=1 Tax=Liolophura sinensis TaxID=3198878 RepID=UPI0031592158